MFEIYISDPRPVRIEIVCNQCGRVIVRREMSIEENVTSASLFGTTDGKAVTAHSCESPHPGAHFNWISWEVSMNPGAGKILLTEKPIHAKTLNRILILSDRTPTPPVRLITSDVRCPRHTTSLSVNTLSQSPSHCAIISCHSSESALVGAVKAGVRVLYPSAPHCDEKTIDKFVLTCTITCRASSRQMTYSRLHAFWLRSFRQTCL